MHKRLIAIGLALALGGLSTSALAAHAGDPGQFYIGAGVGQAKWNIDHGSDINLDDSDTAFNVHFGYVWHWGIDFAIEGGYADLGKVTANWKDVYTNIIAKGKDAYDTYHETAESHAVFAGVKVKYHFAQNWFVSGRGGITQTKYEDHMLDTYQEAGDQSSTTSNYLNSDETNTGWYAGVGIGYDLSRHFGLGLAYDYYHGEFAAVDANIGTVTLNAEYRF